MATKIPATVRNQLQFKVDPNVNLKKGPKAWVKPREHAKMRDRVLKKEMVTGPFATADNHPATRDRWVANNCDDKDIPARSQEGMLGVNKEGYAVVPMDPSDDRFTGESYEYFYEEIEDPKTGIKDINYRNDVLSRGF